MTGDANLTNTLIHRCVGLSIIVHISGGKYVWEWPSRCDLWKDWRVRGLTTSDGSFVDVSSAAVGWHFVNEAGVKKYVQNKLRIFTTDA